MSFPIVTLLGILATASVVVSGFGYSSDFSEPSSTKPTTSQKMHTMQVEDYLEFLGLHMGDSLENLTKKIGSADYSSVLEDGGSLKMYALPNENFPEVKSIDITFALDNEDIIKNIILYPNSLKLLALKGITDSKSLPISMSRDEILTVFGNPTWESSTRSIVQYRSKSNQQVLITFIFEGEKTSLMAVSWK